MSSILVIDDSPLATSLLADHIRERGHDVVTLGAVEELTPEFLKAHPLDVAVVDLSFNESHLTGIDALMILHEYTAHTKLVLFTQGDKAVAELLRDAWEAFDLACVVSKTAPISNQIEAIDEVARTGKAPMDPVLQMRLPSKQSPWRTINGYGRLVTHAGHAKLWRALIAAHREPSYRDLADQTGLSLNTVRNYREQLLPELSLHGMDNPTMREMQSFAERCRPFLEPFITAKLGKL